MLVRDVMTTDCEICNTDTTVVEAARLMADKDIGFVPVAKDDKLIGTLTDRDIVIRGVASRIDADAAKVTDLMSDEVYYCTDDQDCRKVAANMAELGVRRLPVVNQDKRLVGTVSLGDIAKNDHPDSAGHALAGISRMA